MEKKETGRVIKFRVWNKEKRQWERHALGMGTDGSLITNHNEDFVLCQFTGLKDKNGKEIFEGDLITLNTFANVENGEVRWDGIRASFYARFKDLDYYFPSGPKPERVEVIGNIYEHPHLLKV